MTVWGMFLFLPCIFILVTAYYGFFPDKTKKSSLSIEEIKLYYEKTIKEQSAKLTEESQFFESNEFSFFYDEVEKKLYFFLPKNKDIFSIELHSFKESLEKGKLRKKIATIENGSNLFGWYSMLLDLGEGEDVYAFLKVAKISPEKKQNILKKSPKEYKQPLEEKK